MTKNGLTRLIREYADLHQSELEDYGLGPGSREVLTGDVLWLNQGGLQNRSSGRTAWLLAGTEIEVGRTSDDGSRTEVYDLRRDRLFTVNTRDLISGTE